MIDCHRKRGNFNRKNSVPSSIFSGDMFLSRQESGKMNQREHQGALLPFPHNHGSVKIGLVFGGSKPGE